MMGKLAYALFIMLDGFAVGAAVMGVYFETKLMKQAMSTLAHKKHRYAALGKAGFAVTGLILLYRVIELGALAPELIAWVYLIGLAVAGFGFAGATSIAADELASSEIDNGRFVTLEKRVTVEESRNTDIEQLARDHASGTTPHEHEGEVKHD